MENEKREKICGVKRSEVIMVAFGVGTAQKILPNLEMLSKNGTPFQEIPGNDFTR